MVHSTTKVLERITKNTVTKTFLCSLFVVASAWAVVCMLSRQADQSTLIQFLLLALLMVFATLAVLWRCQNTGQKLRFRWILASAIVLRLISLAGEPLFEDDYYRYLWDGYQTATTMDPYSHAPEKFFDEDVPEIFEPVLSFINYPEFATVYGPTIQWIFALAYLIAPGEIWPLQLMSVIADIVVLCLLRQLGAGNALLLYAWSPLILKEHSLTAHPDIFSIVLVMASILAAYRKRAFIAGIALGLAVGAKIFALLIVPYLFSLSLAKDYWLRLGSAIVGSITLITLSFGTFKIWLPEGLLAMADSWLFNSPLYYILLPVLDFSTIKSVLLTAFTVCSAVLFFSRLSKIYRIPPYRGTKKLGWKESPSAFRGDCLFAAFLLCLPVINPWYVTWLLPFATLYPRSWSWTVSYTVLLSYWYGSNVGAIGNDSLQLPFGVLFLEFYLVLLVPVVAWLYRRIKA